MPKRKPPSVRKEIYLRELKKAGYDLDLVLEFLREGSLIAKRRFDRDYTRDKDHPDPSERGHFDDFASIRTEAWSDCELNKKTCSLVCEKDYCSYENISVNRKKLDELISGSKEKRGAPPKYDETAFLKDLAIHLCIKGLPAPSISHERWCNQLFQALPFLQNSSTEAPSLDWVKRKTQFLWDRVKTRKNS